LGIGDWGLGPIPNPQSPIPNQNSLYINLNNKAIYMLLITFSYVKLNITK